MSTLFEPKFQWLPADLEEYCWNIIDRPMPRGRGDLRYRNLPENLSKSHVNGKQHIIFVSYYPDVSILKMSKVLRDEANCFTTLVACCIREDTEIFRWVDQAYEVKDYKELLSLIAQTAPAAMCVLVGPGTLILGAVVIAARPDCAISINVRDLILFLHKDSEDKDCRLEKAVLEHCDSFIHKMPPEAIKEMRITWSVKTPDYLVHSLPLSELFVSSEGKRKNGSLKIVYPGGIIPYKIAVQRGYGNHIFEPMLRTVTEQGIELYIYLNQNARNMYWEEHEVYFSFAHENPGFQCLKGVPYFRLPQAICYADFGLHYENIIESTHNPKHYKYNMATKIFSFLEAELPILVHTKAPYICDLVEQYGLGIVYSIDEMDNLKEVALRTNVTEVRENIRDFRQKHNMATTVPVLTKALGIS